jgi:hypothetical protein
MMKIETIITFLTPTVATPVTKLAMFSNLTHIVCLAMSHTKAAMPMAQTNA